jgi:hypothetical protein
MTDRNKQTENIWFHKEYRQSVVCVSVVSWRNAWNTFQPGESDKGSKKRWRK